MKYGNRKTVVNGITFDSKKEARRWQELRLLERAGEITNLSRQVPYELIPPQRRDDGKPERAVSYIADFTYDDHGKRVVEDTKGMKTRDYIIKRKLLLKVHGITVKEV